MPRPPGSADPDLWTLELPPSQDTSVGCMCGARINADGTTEEGRENEDRYYTCKLDGIQLYLVLDGHNGSRACEFARKRLPSLLLHYNMGESGEHAAEALRHSFQNTEKHFFMMLDPSITRKVGLQLEIQEQGGTTSMMAYSLFPDKVEELHRLEELIKGGTTAVVALILENRHLWVANVGDSRAVLCYLDKTSKLHAEQISEDHNTQNEKEIARLVKCGLDELSLRNSGRLGMHQNTRSIGDYSIKGGYKDHDILSAATKEPGTAEPFISHPQIDITTIKGFLLLMSDGLYNAYVSISNSQHTVNHDVACLVQRYMDRTHTVDGIAQLVIDEISDRFHAMVKQDKRSARLDDITLVIRNLGYPMGQLAVTATAPPTVKNPFNFSQSQPHPSTRGSAMPHPPVGMPHYENSQFFRKQFDTLPPSLAHQPYSHTPNVSTGSMYTPPQQHVYAMHSRPSDVYTTNSMYAENVHTMAHHPHPSGPNTQFSVTGQHTKLYSSSSTTSSAATAAASLPQGMRKSGSDPRVGLPPPVPQHDGHEPLQSYAHGAGYQGQAYPTSQPDTTLSPLPASSVPPPRSSSGTAIYENCDPGRNLWGERSRKPVAATSSIPEVTGTLGAVQLGSQGVAPPPAPATMTTREVTNAEFPYHTVQQGASLNTNSTTEWSPTVNNTSSPARSAPVKQPSTLDDESWMYDQESVTSSVNQPNSVTDAPEDTVTGAGEGEGGARGEVIGNGKGEGGNGDNTEVVELEFPTDDQPVKQGEEEEDGMIKPIIRFDKFPHDLSWDQI